MKKLLTATAATALLAGAAMADDVKLGILFGFTGPIESLAPAMGSGAELAMKEVTDSGKLLDGATVTPMRADTGCIDNGLATSNGERMIAEGLDSLFPMQELSLMGLVEILPKARQLLRRIRQTADAVLESRPDAVVTIDSPGFNMRLAKAAHKLGSLL